MSTILSAKTVFPEYKYTQGQIIDYLSSLWPDVARAAERFHRNTQVETRHLAVPLEDYAKLGDFGNRNNLWIEKALPLAQMAASIALDAAGMDASEISAIFSTSITGIAVPSVEARLMNRMNFKANTKRIPIFGLGCLGGAAGIARAHDYLRAYPDQAVLLLATELCSLTFQLDDHSVANLVATGLFADGGAAVVLVGDKHPKAGYGKLQVLDSMSEFYPDSERTMGWDITGNGFKIVLAGDVPKVVQDNVPNGVKSFLDNNKLALSDIGEVIAHPGGPKVLDALASALERDRTWFEHSWQSLAENGNMSSVSVLDILARTIATPIEKSKYGLLMAMGPAFCSEMVLTKRIP